MPESAAVVDEAARGPLETCFVTRPADTRALGRLRQVIAVLALGASLLVWLGRLPLTIALVATLGALVALAWWRLGSRDVQRAATAAPDGLWLHREGLLMRQDGALMWLDWAEVTRVSIDEERLRICLHRGDRNAVHLCSHYAGHAIEEVADALARCAGVPGPYAPHLEGSQSSHDDLQ